MKKSILVTGMAGSGKSAVCEELNKQGYKAYDIEDMDGLFKMVDKKTGEIFMGNDNDNLEIVKKRDWICDVEKLQKLVGSESSDVAFYCGTASNLDKILPFFDMIILLKSSPEILRKRLSSRKPGEFGRTKEVQDWVLSYKDWWEKETEGKGTIIIDADRRTEEVVKNVVEAASKKLGEERLIDRL